MKILVTNDDGLNSNGMVHLEKELSGLGEVWVVAPDRERSGSSMAISIHEPLRIERVAARCYRINGYPTDCVNVAMRGGDFPVFDLVVSGINHGVNMGDDVFFSGTVGAARLAAMIGIRSLAVSCPIRDSDGDFSRVSRWVREWLEENFQRIEPGVVYNINYPSEDTTQNGTPLPESRLTMQGRRVYRDEYRVLERAEHVSVIRLDDTPPGYEIDPGTDFEAVERGFVSITPLLIDTTALDELHKWQTTPLPAEKN